MLTGKRSSVLSISRRLGLTELICEVIISFKDFNQVIKHGKVDRYFRGDFFH